MIYNKCKGKYSSTIKQGQFKFHYWQFILQKLRQMDIKIRFLNLNEVHVLCNYYSSGWTLKMKLEQKTLLIALITKYLN